MKSFVFSMKIYPEKRRQQNDQRIVPEKGVWRRHDTEKKKWAKRESNVLVEVLVVVSVTDEQR